MVVKEMFTEPDVKTICLSADNTQLAIITNRIILWELLRRTRHTLAGTLVADVKTASYAHHNTDMIIGMVDGTVCLVIGEKMFQFKAHDTVVNAVLFMPDDKSFVTASTDTTIKIWDIATKCLMASIKYDSGINSICLAPSTATTIVSGHEDGTIWLWNYRTNDKERMENIVERMAIIYIKYLPTWTNEILAHKLLNDKARYSCQ